MKAASVVMGRKVYLYLQYTAIPLFSLALLSYAEPTRKWTLTKRVGAAVLGNAPICGYCWHSYTQHYQGLKEQLARKYLVRGRGEQVYK